MRMRTRGFCLLIAMTLAGCAGEDAPTTPLTGHDPYPYTTPTPPPEPTPLDGVYARSVTAVVVGGAGECRRCPPYRLAVGSDILILDEGVFEVYHMESGYLSVGHFITDGSKITFFNDPNCPHDRGAYLVTSVDGMWSLVAVDDPCAYDSLRERFLIAVPWMRIEPPEGVYTSANGELLAILNGVFTLDWARGEIGGTATYTGEMITVEGPTCRQELEWWVGQGTLQLVTIDPICREDWVSLLVNGQWAGAG